MYPLISVVIPVYKTEKYLSDCVNSVIQQTYRNLEIILVDDGSPDKCPQISDEFAQLDQRIKVVHKENGGLSDARNRGIDNASGDFIIFLDSDDFWIGKDSIDKLIAVLVKEPESDIIFFGRTNVIGDHSYVSHKLNPENINNKSKVEALTSALNDACFVASACLKLIRTSLIKNNLLYFQKGLLSEDWDWSINLYLKAKSFSAIDDNFYGYRKHLGSISQSFNLKHSDHLLLILDKWTNKLPNEPDKDPFFGFLAYIYCCALISNEALTRNDCRNQRRKFLKYKYLLKYNFNPRVKKIALLNDILGYNITCSLLGFANKMKRRKLS